MPNASLAQPATPPRWKRAFPDFEGMPDGIPPGFRDVSWRNDAMPSFLNADLGLLLFVDHADAARRGEPDAPRFLLARSAPDGTEGEEVLATEHWDEVMEAVAEASMGNAPRM